MLPRAEMTRSRQTSRGGLGSQGHRASGRGQRPTTLQRSPSPSDVAVSGPPSQQSEGDHRVSRGVGGNRALGGPGLTHPACPLDAKGAPAPSRPAPLLLAAVAASGKRISSLQTHDPPDAPFCFYSRRQNSSPSYAFPSVI